jgi:hypothetical protein
MSHRQMEPKAVVQHHGDQRLVSGAGALGGHARLVAVEAETGAVVRDSWPLDAGTPRGEMPIDLGVEYVLVRGVPESSLDTTSRLAAGGGMRRGCRRRAEGEVPALGGRTGRVGGRLHRGIGDHRL